MPISRRSPPPISTPPPPSRYLRAHSSMRILGIIAALDDTKVSYLGSDTQSREAFARAEMEAVSQTYLHSSYGKVTLARPS